MKERVLIVLFAMFLIVSLTACLGLSSNTSGCGYSQYEDICTDTWLPHAIETEDAYKESLGY